MENFSRLNTFLSKWVQADFYKRMVWPFFLFRSSRAEQTDDPVDLTTDDESDLDHTDNEHWEEQGLEEQGLEEQGLEEQGLEEQGLEEQGLEEQGLEEQMDKTDLEMEIDSDAISIDTSVDLENEKCIRHANE